MATDNVGLPSSRDLLDASDLDNYAYPLAKRLRDPDLVSVWCTKRHGEQSSVRICAAREVPAPEASGVVVATTAASATSIAYKDAIHAAVSGAAVLPDGPVRLELSFVIGPRRNWLNLWKPTIDALDPLLGRTRPDRAWHPRDGRITELGLHCTVDQFAGNKVAVGIYASTEPVTAGDQSSLGVSQRPVGDVVNDEPLDVLAVADHSTPAHEFRDDDAGYLNWLAANPEGFVVNIARNYSVSTARVHHATCRTISGQNPHNGPWTGAYVKVCAVKSADAEEWAANTVRMPIPPCGTCRPSCG
ncbi:hypothetical protein [Mycolicibacterium fallax]|uniref:hypothetical protein n=1 Tax=Mycolicibacterium fallax TaxID=1793 RepID=UPI001055DD2B|nr:hypothetical protein [Mycolicibacterium fallax]